jgi:gliding motility-associated-like protein
MINLEVSPDVTIVEGESADLFAGGAFSFEWLPDATLDFGNVSNPVATPMVTTTYTVIGTSANGCTDTAMVTVTVLPMSHLYVPNAFTPNNDGLNDVFRVIPDGSFDTILLQVFNRWGELVFESNHVNDGWDGNFKNHPQEIGTYVYHVVATDNETLQTIELKGNITLLR